MGCMYDGKWLWWLGKALIFVLGSLVFSWIFWAVKKGMDKPRKKKKR